MREESKSYLVFLKVFYISCLTFDVTFTVYLFFIYLFLKYQFKLKLVSTRSQNSQKTCTLDSELFGKNLSVFLEKSLVTLLIKNTLSLSAVARSDIYQR